VKHRISRLACVGCIFAVVLSFISLRLTGQTARQPALQSPAAQLMALGKHFQGAASCSSAKCHGGPAAVENGESFSNEYTLWSSEMNQQADPHHSKTWAALKNPQGKKIAQGLGIADATASERCLSCHALSVPAALQGKDYRLNEGVTCNACHGPSEKWLDPHSKKGWYTQQRAANDFNALLTNWALYDTRPVHARAERCTSCHLAIDPQLVANGHPQPAFELNYFSETYPNRHWHDADGYFKAKLWSGGQQVALYEALRQLADRSPAGGQPLTDAYNQAMSHYSVLSQFLTTALPSDAAALTTSIKAVQAAYTSKAGLDAAATAAAQADANLAGPVEKFEPTQAVTLKVLNGIAAQSDLATTYGRVGQDQQAYAIYALYSAYASAEKPKDADTITGLIGDKLFADPAPAPPQFVKNLAEVQAKLPK
jgi:uncharacterized protein